jgi:integrase/recombinase XerD
MARQPSRVEVAGLLEPYAGGFGAELTALGYAPLSAANQLRVMAHLSRWLGQEGLTPQELTPERAEAFLSSRRALGYTCWLSERGLTPLLSYLRRLGVAPTPVFQPPGTPAGILVEDYRCYLVRERGLVATTVAQYGETARLFLSRCVNHTGELELEAVTAAEVTEFVMRECPTRSVGTAKLLVTGLRSLLRFLHIEGYTAISLAPAVPGVAGWRGSSLPRALPVGQVEQLLASCDERPVGRRDFAILVVLARLGLRAAEVAALEMGDIDWRAGELLIRGKGRREERLPLPGDVGEAIVTYLRRGRPACSDRALFVRANAPHRRVTASAIRGVVRNACDRAGLPQVGAHRLRHTVATEMLRAGAPLAEVSQMLRQRDAATTAIYAKVDRAGLRSLALPWPGGAA